MSWLIRMIAVIVLAALAAPWGSAAQTPKVARIAIAFLGSPADQAPRVAIIQDGLRELGWVEGKNVVFDVRWAEGRPERLPGIAAELLRLNPHVIVTSGTRVIRAFQRATSTVPIVAAIMSDPIGSGFAASFPRPGGNITGGAFQSADLSTKRLELLTEILPRLSRVAVLFDGGDPDPATQASAASLRRATEEAARALRVELQVLEVRGPGDFERAFEDARRGRAQALLQIASSLFFPHRERLAELARKNRLPATCETRDYVVAGCLLSYGPNFDAMFRRAPFYVDRILRGTKPGDLPIEQPARFELALNLQTAKALGLTIPPLILARVDELIR